MTVEHILGIEVQLAADEPYGWLWRHSASEGDWQGPETSEENARQAAVLDVLYLAQVGRVFIAFGTAEAEKLLPRV